MMLKDCPVGSFVRLVSFMGDTNYADKYFWWSGVFEVLEGNGEKFIKDRDGDDRCEIYSDPDFQFEIVTPASAQHKTIYLKGKTYKLIPARTSSFIEIDGVEYYMEEK